MNSTSTGVAMAFAMGAHHGQTDKAGFAFISHPARVARAIELNGLPSHMVAAAWLHDVVEDTRFSLGYLRTIFDERICELVDLLTQREGESYEDYIDRVCTDPEAITIKLADIADNTMPERMLALEPEDMKRLARKYADALVQITRSENYAAAP